MMILKNNNLEKIIMMMMMIMMTQEQEKINAYTFIIILGALTVIPTTYLCPVHAAAPVPVQLKLFDSHPPIRQLRSHAHLIPISPQLLHTLTFSSSWWWCWWKNENECYRDEKERMQKSKVTLLLLFFCGFMRQSPRCRCTGIEKSAAFAVTFY